MDAFSKLPAEINELVSSFTSTPIVGNLVHGVTQYTFWLVVSSIILMALMFIYSRRITSLVPRGLFMNGVEWVVEFVKNDIIKSILGDSWKRHFPFLATLFFFILINNIVGIIPGMKPGTGTISTTAALAIVVFIYFVACGVKAQGPVGYFKSFAPKGWASRSTPWCGSSSSSPPCCAPSRWRSVYSATCSPATWSWARSPSW